MHNSHALTYFAIPIALILAGCRPGEVIEPPDMKAPVELGEPSIQTVEKVVESVGTLKAKEQAILITENEGRLVMGKNADGKRLDEGDYVQKGQLCLLYTSDAADE